VVENLPHWVDAVLSRFEGQVYVDLSWVVYEDYILKDLESWARLIKKYPESFMLGSDVVGGGGSMGSELGKFTALMDEISIDQDNVVRRNFVRDNFVRLMSDLQKRQRARMLSEKLISRETPEWTGLILKPDYEYDEKAHTGARTHSFIQEYKPKP
jgi:hypothetical protein